MAKRKTAERSPAAPEAKTPRKTAAAAGTAKPARKKPASPPLKTRLQPDAPWPFPTGKRP